MDGAEVGRPTGDRIGAIPCSHPSADGGRPASALWAFLGRGETLQIPSISTVRFAGTHEGSVPCLVTRCASVTRTEIEGVTQSVTPRAYGFLEHRAGRITELSTQVAWLATIGAKVLVAAVFSTELGAHPNQMGLLAVVTFYSGVG